MKKKLFVALVLCLFLGGMSQAEVVIVDDHFDDGAIGTNTTGTGTGFNSFGAGGGTVTEADSYAQLNVSGNGAARPLITSKDGAAIGSGITRYEFKGITFSSAGGTGSGGPARTVVAVKHDAEANEPDNNTDAGFYVQFENNSLSNTANDGAENGTSALIYVAEDNTRTVLATWEFDTLNWDSGTENFTPVLDVTLDLDADGYSLTIEGDTISNVTGALENTYTAAGITNELTTGYAYVFSQTEFPLINLWVDQIIVAEDAAPAAGAPSNPVVTPDNGDGTVGNLVNMGGGIWQVQDVTLSFIAAGDPNELHVPQYTINPDIIQHNIWLQTGAPEDPNLYLYDSVAADNATGYEDPNVSYGPLPSNLLKQATTYKWQVEEVLDNGAGGYPAGDPNNIVGSVWSFTTGSATPAITSISDHQLTDVNGDAALTIETGAIATDYRWYRVVNEQDSDENAEIDDVELTDADIYSGTQTKTLVITGAAADGSDDARYYAIAYNGDPEGNGIASAPSAVRWVWYPRLVNRYTFEDMDTSSDPNGVTTDIVSGYNARMANNDIGDDVPVREPNVLATLAGSTYSLKFDNPNTGGDPNVIGAQYAQVDERFAGSYKDVTVSAWVYWNGGGNWQRILDFGNDTNYYMFLSANTGGENGQVRFAVKDASEQGISAPTGTLPIGEWTYVAATLSGSTARLYVDGELVATSTNITHNPVNYGPTANNWIGRSQWGGDAYFNGLLDELKIYNYGLTTEEVGKDYLADTQEEYVCNLELDDLEYDFNDNCLIDLGDIAMFVERWLDSYRIYPTP